MPVGLASQKSGNEIIKNFGQEMVKDHSENDNALRVLAASHGVEVPTTVDSEHASQKAKLENKKGSWFDKEYINAQVRENEKVVGLLQREIREGRDPAIRDFAQKTLPGANHHLAMVKLLQAMLPTGVA